METKVYSRYAINKIVERLKAVLDYKIISFQYFPECLLIHHLKVERV